MRQLNCADEDAARASLLEILGIPGEFLDAALDQYREAHPEETLVQERALLRVLTGVIGRPLIAATFVTRYFHATRSTALESPFCAEGLLPLHHVLDRIWDQLFGLLAGAVSSEEWARFRTEFEGSTALPNAHLYHMRTRDRRGGGPFGFLIREVATAAPGATRRYLDAPPEIVEDIGLALQAWNGIDLTARYLAASRPYLAWFNGPQDGGAVRVALEYLYVKRHALTLSTLGWSFNGKGRQIRPERIVRVETLADGY